MLLPKRVKHRKQFRGRMTGKANKGNTVSHGEYGLAALEPAFYRSELLALHRDALGAWLSAWGDRVLADGEPAAQRVARMNAANPCYVLRNYLAQQAIELAERGDPARLHELLAVLRHPYDEQPGQEAYAARRPDWARDKPGCSMLSCSS